MPEAFSDEHVWVMATTLPLPENLVRNAQRRGTVRLPVPAGNVKVDVLQIYCDHCRRSYDDVADRPCEAAVSHDHLIGGPTGERKKRKHPYHDCADYGCEIPTRSVG